MSNFTDLRLARGELALALELGEAAVRYADKSGEAILSMPIISTLASVNHQAGDLESAIALFKDAKALLPKVQLAHPRYYSRLNYHNSRIGYRHYDLLLDLGRANEVLSLATHTLKKAENNGVSILSIALEHLALGRAMLMQGTRDGAHTHLEKAVLHLRMAGAIDHIPRGLLARAAFFREVAEYEKSRKDLDEAMRIATRSGMRLFKCDAHLEYARLAIKQDQPDAARVHLKSAAELVTACGYHRRDTEVDALKKELETAPS